MRITPPLGSPREHMHRACQERDPAERPKHQGRMLLCPLANGRKALEEIHRRGLRSGADARHVQRAAPRRITTVAQRASIRCWWDCAQVPRLTKNDQNGGMSSLSQQPAPETPACLADGRSLGDWSSDHLNEVLGFRGALVQLRVELGIGGDGHVRLCRLRFELVNDLFEQRWQTGLAGAFKQKGTVSL